MKQFIEERIKSTKKLMLLFKVKKTIFEITQHDSSQINILKIDKTIFCVWFGATIYFKINAFWNHGMGI